MPVLSYFNKGPNATIIEASHPPQQAAAEAAGVPLEDAPLEDAPLDDVYEEPEGLDVEEAEEEHDASVPDGMVEASSEAVDRTALSREEKLALDSAEVGYPLAHTTSETWGDEHMPKTPVEDEKVTPSPEPVQAASLMTQRTLMDEELDASPTAACCVIDSSPEEASASSGPPGLSRRPHISKSWNSDFSPKLTKDQKARFLEACRQKMLGLARPAAPATALTSM